VKALLLVPYSHHAKNKTFLKNNRVHFFFDGIKLIEKVFGCVFCKT
jgi:hypothetical protein